MRRVLLAALLLGALLYLPGSSRGGPYDDYKSLNKAERRLALRYFWQLGKVRSAADLARRESTARYPNLSGQDDQRDAHRHSTWNGAMTAKLKSERAAKRWGDAHEEIPNNPAQRKAMDLSNNAKGRAIVWSQRQRTGPWWWRKTRFPSERQIADRMQQAVDAGELVMIEAVNGQRDPQSGRHVPTQRP